MNTNIEVLRELDELVEAARLLGVTQAKRGFGCHTDEDRRFERAMRESIDKHRAALLAERDALAAEVERLADALRELEDRAQRDEALLRQALEQPEALRLADHLERFRSFPDDLAAAAELRRLHTENEAKDALLRQALDRLEAVVERFDPYIGDNECRPMENARSTITALRERLGKGGPQ